MREQRVLSVGVHPAATSQLVSTLRSRSSGITSLHYVHTIGASGRTGLAQAGGLLRDGGGVGEEVGSCTYILCL